MEEAEAGSSQMLRKQNTKYNGPGPSGDDPVKPAHVSPAAVGLVDQAAFPVTGEMDFLNNVCLMYALIDENADNGTIEGAGQARAPKPIVCHDILRQRIAATEKPRRLHRRERDYTTFDCERFYRREVRKQAGPSPFVRKPKLHWIKITDDVYKDRATKNFYIKSCKTQEFSIMVPTCYRVTLQHVDDKLKKKVTPSRGFSRIKHASLEPDSVKRPDRTKASLESKEGKEAKAKARKSFQPPPPATFVDKTPIQRLLPLPKKRDRKKLEAELSSAKEAKNNLKNTNELLETDAPNKPLPATANTKKKQENVSLKTKLPASIPRQHATQTPNKKEQETEAARVKSCSNEFQNKKSLEMTPSSHAAWGDYKLLRCRIRIAPLKKIEKGGVKKKSVSAIRNSPEVTSRRRKSSKEPTEKNKRSSEGDRKKSSSDLSQKNFSSMESSIRPSVVPSSSKKVSSVSLFKKPEVPNSSSKLLLPNPALSNGGRASIASSFKKPPTPTALLSDKKKTSITSSFKNSTSSPSFSMGVLESTPKKAGLTTLPWLLNRKQEPTSSASLKNGGLDSSNGRLSSTKVGNGNSPAPSPATRTESLAAKFQNKDTEKQPSKLEIIRRDLLLAVEKAKHKKAPVVAFEAGGSKTKAHGLHNQLLSEKTASTALPNGEQAPNLSALIQNGGIDYSNGCLSSAIIADENLTASSPASGTQPTTAVPDNATEKQPSTLEILKRSMRLAVEKAKGRNRKAAVVAFEAGRKAKADEPPSQPPPSKKSHLDQDEPDHSSSGAMEIKENPGELPTLPRESALPTQSLSLSDDDEEDADILKLFVDENEFDFL